MFSPSWPHIVIAINRLAITYQAIKYIAWTIKSHHSETKFILIFSTYHDSIITSELMNTHECLHSLRCLSSLQSNELGHMWLYHDTRVFDLFDHRFGSSWLWVQATIRAHWCINCTQVSIRLFSIWEKAPRWIFLCSNRLLILTNTWPNFMGSNLLINRVPIDDRLWQASNPFRRMHLPPCRILGLPQGTPTGSTTLLDPLRSPNKAHSSSFRNEIKRSTHKHNIPYTCSNRFDMSLSSCILTGEPEALSSR